MRNYFKLCTPNTALTSIPVVLFDSRNYGLYISGAGTLQIPGINWNPVSIPGRPGDVLMNPQLENQPLVYPAGIAPVNGTCGNYPDYLTAVSAARESILRLFLLYGYLELVDSYYPEIFRRVYYAEVTDFDSQTDLKSGTCTLTFSASPQRFLTRETTSGSSSITVINGSPKSIEWSSYHSQVYGILNYCISPKIQVSSAGTFHFETGGVTIMSVTVSSSVPSFPLYIDSQLKECSYGINQNANQFVSFSDYKFPEFHTPWRMGGGNVSAVVDTVGMSIFVSPGWWAL